MADFLAENCMVLEGRERAWHRDRSTL